LPVPLRAVVELRLKANVEDGLEAVVSNLGVDSLPGSDLLESLLDSRAAVAGTEPGSLPVDARIAVLWWGSV